MNLWYLKYICTLWIRSRTGRRTECTPSPQTLLVRVLLKRTTNRIISITIDDPTLMQRPPQIFKWFYLSYIKWTFNVLNNKCLISLIDFWIKKWWNMAAVPEQSFPIFFFFSFYVFFFLEVLVINASRMTLGIIQIG